FARRTRYRVHASRDCPTVILDRTEGSNVATRRAVHVFLADTLALHFEVQVQSASLQFRPSHVLLKVRLTVEVLAHPSPRTHLQTAVWDSDWSPYPGTTPTRQIHPGPGLPN